MNKSKHFLFLLIITLLCKGELRATEVSIVPNDLDAQKVFIKPPLERSEAFTGIELLEACGLTLTQTETNELDRPEDAPSSSTSAQGFELTIEKEKTETTPKRKSAIKYTRTWSFNFNREDDRILLGQTLKEFSKKVLWIKFGSSYEKNPFYKFFFAMPKLTEEKPIKNLFGTKEDLSEGVNISAAKEEKTEEGISESL